jgi:ABC-type Fe3+/spermidine/putrescine transport system ATPase subunit
LLAGLDAPDTGVVQIDGRRVSEEGRISSPRRIAASAWSSGPGAWPHLSVRENLEFGLRGGACPPASESVGSATCSPRSAWNASWTPTRPDLGQQQRVALARALAQEPRVLLLDEPLSSLDPELRSAMRDEILRLHATLGFTLILVTHESDDAKALSTRRVAMPAHPAL